MTPETEGAEERKEETGEIAPSWVINVENVLVVLCILPLWPFILGYRGPKWQALMYATLAALVIIFIRRWKRLKAAFDAMEKREGDGPQMPFLPPGRKL